MCLYMFISSIEPGASWRPGPVQAAMSLYSSASSALLGLRRASTNVYWLANLNEQIVSKVFAGNICKEKQKQNNSITLDFWKVVFTDEESLLDLINNKNFINPQ